MVEIGESAPKINLVDTEMKKVSLPKASKGKAAVIAFFPGAFTGVCTKEMCTFRDVLEEFNSLNANVYAISVDSPFSNKAFKEKNQLNFTVLSDLKKRAIKQFDVVFKNFAFVKGYTAAKRSVFVVDTQGIVKYKWITDDPTVEPDYNAVKEAVKQAQ